MAGFILPFDVTIVDNAMESNYSYLVAQLHALENYVMNANLNAAQKEALEVADAWLNNVALPLASQMMTKQPVCQVEVRSVYGNPTIYPVNEAAKKLTAIAGKKTLDKLDLANIQALGFVVVEASLKKLAA